VAFILTLAPCLKQLEASVLNPWFESLPSQALLQRLGEHQEARPTDALKET